MRPQATFSFFIFLQLFHFFTLLIAPSSTSLLSPRPSFLLVHPSSSSLLPPHPSFLFVPPSSSSLLPPHPSKRRTDRRIRPLIEMRTHLKRRRRKKKEKEEEEVPYVIGSPWGKRLSRKELLMSHDVNRKILGFVFVNFSSFSCASSYHHS